MKTGTKGDYDTQFFQSLQVSSASSAKVIAPMVIDWIEPASVIDIGCGTGAWLSVFGDLGVADLHGVDGDHVDRSLLDIPRDRFEAHNLEHAYAADRVFDLAMSLEVAEHLPEECAVTYVQSLTTLAPVVLFSAAIPHQGGEGHVNCHWPDYWATLFKNQEYVAVDCLRPRIWGNSSVAWWYQQNMVLYIRTEALRNYPKIEELRESCPEAPPSLVHPECLQAWVDWGMEQSERYWDVLKETQLGR